MVGFEQIEQHIGKRRAFENSSVVTVAYALGQTCP